MKRKQSKTKSLNALRKNIAAKLAANTETSAPKFVVDKKKVHSIGGRIVESVKHAHEGVRAELVKLKGERPETLEAIKDDISARIKAWLKEEGKRISTQAIYNVGSELKAACNGYMAYAGMSAAKRKLFDQKHAKITGYHQLIKFLRDTKRGKAKTPDVNQAVARIKSGWKNRKGEMMKQAKNLLRYSPTEALLNLIDFAEALVKARKQGNVEKMADRQRKAA